MTEHELFEELVDEVKAQVGGDVAQVLGVVNYLTMPSGQRQYSPVFEVNSLGSQVYARLREHATHGRKVWSRERGDFVALRREYQRLVVAFVGDHLMPLAQELEDGEIPIQGVRIFG